MTPLEVLDAAVTQGLARPVIAPSYEVLCGKVMGERPGMGRRCWRPGRWEFPGSGFSGRMCTQHGAWFIRPKLGGA